MSRLTEVTLRWLSTLGVLAAVGCGPPALQQPPGKAPTPKTVTVEEPGGDASDPHAAALKRLLAAPWGRRNDKDGQLEAPTPDWENWTRVRFWGVDHFTGFRYGDDHHVVAVVLVQEVPPGTPTDSRTCMHRFEAWARPQVKAFDVQMGPVGEHDSEWRGHPISVEFVDGAVDFMLQHREFSAAWATYPAYPDACLVYAVAVPWRGHAKLARELRDRWVEEGFQGMRPLTPKGPHRLP